MPAPPVFCCHWYLFSCFLIFAINNCWVSCLGPHHFLLHVTFCTFYTYHTETSMLHVKPLDIFSEGPRLWTLVSVTKLSLPTDPHGVGKCHSPQYISGAEQQHGIAAFSWSSEITYNGSIQFLSGPEILNWFDKTLFTPILKLKSSVQLLR